ncbi:MAG: hypothetical protein AAB300_01100 [Nitrospirota bacterium]
MTLSKFQKLTNVFMGMAAIVWLFGCDTTKTVSEADLIAEAFEKADQQTTFLLTDAPSDDFQSVSVDILSPIQVTMNGAIYTTPQKLDRVTWW